MIEMIKKALHKILIEDQDFLLNNEDLKYWKNKIFYITAVAMLILGAPLMFYGAYLFYREGDITFAIGEVLIYIISVIIITQKSFSIGFKKYYIIYVLYIISILLLITTGLMGAGMVCVVCSLILAGCLLEKKQIFKVVIVNITTFVILTALIFNGYFDGTVMETYKKVWLINGITAQTCGIILLFLMNTIYNGLDNQNQQIKKSEESLAASGIKHKGMIANISDAIVIVDINGVVTYNSPNLMQRFTWMSEDITSRHFSEEIHPDDRDYITGVLQSLLEKNGLKKTVEARYLDKDGGVGYIELTAVNLTKDLNIKGILINFSNITERKMREEEILYLSYHDSLTGLYNRTFFEIEKKRLDTESQLPLSVIIGDINGLKIINDSLGHAEGDKLLFTIGRILACNCRKEDIIARQGGDEFNILLPRTSNDIAYQIIDAINSACEDYNKKVSSELFHISISLGAATKTSTGLSLDSIFKIAEDFMYNRKLLEGRSFHSSIISSMKMALFEKSHETEEHAQRLVNLTRAVGHAVGLTNQQFDELELFSTLHDIGKIGIDDHILNKPAKLTDEEWVNMKKHAEIGYRIAMASPELMSIAYFILTHHERWDGKGYPRGLIGENIPLLSRILSVVDAYDAMTHDRPYRKGMLKQEAITELINNAGTQFDPDITKTFTKLIS